MSSIPMGDMRGGIGPTSSGIYDEPKSGTSWRKTKICCASFLLFIGVAGIVIAGILPGIVNSAITTGVEHTARLDPNHYTTSQAQKFYNSSQFEDFYLFNITNLYDVLTNGAKINFQEVGPIKTLRWGHRYNVTWDIDNSQVTYNWLTTFEVLPESQPLLDLPIIGPNVFYLGAAAQVYRQYLAQQTGQVTAEFPGYYLNEQVAAAGVLGQVLQGTIPVFNNPAYAKGFLPSVRKSGVVFYTQFALYVANTAGVVGQTLNGWATATPYLSQLPGKGTEYFTGFELGKALTSSSPIAVAAQVFNLTNPYSPTSAAGLTAWATLDVTSPAAVGALMVALNIDNSTDVSTIGAWIAGFGAVLPGDGGVGDAYQNAVCAAMASKIQTAAINATSGTPNNTPFGQMIGPNLVAYIPNTWVDVGALQFGTSFIAAFSFPGADTFLSGKGKSTSELQGGSGPGIPWNLFDGATQPEPMEFTAGIKYYVSNNMVPLTPTGWPANANQAPLWILNPALLFADGTLTGPIITLNINQTLALFTTLGGTGGYGALVQQLQPIVQTYAYVFQQQLAGGNTAAGASAAATGYILQANGTYDTAFGAARSLLPGIVTKTNWYAVWSYLFNYIGNELSGSLAQIDPLSGVAPQNTGLFSKRTVRENLFGYTSRIGTPVDAIAGPLRDPATYDALLAADIASHQGRQWVQDTGHRDINTVGQYIKYEGVDAYQTNCQFKDPALAPNGYCDAANRAADPTLNWQIWGANDTVTGSGDALHIQPFSDDNPVAATTLYVSEVRRPVEILYTGTDVDIKGINLRRYKLNYAVVNASLGPQPNPNKDLTKWKQYSAPDGLFSQQTLLGGIPGLANVPHWGHCDPKVWNGATCDGGDCSTWYNSDAHDTVIDIHPLTGLTMNGAKKLQGSFRVSAQEFYTGTAPGGAAPYPGYPAQLAPNYPTNLAPGGWNYHYNNLFKNTETLFIPYYWANIHDVIQDDDAADVRNSENTISMAKKAKTGVKYGGFIGGSILVVISVAWLVNLCRAK